LQFEFSLRLKFSIATTAQSHKQVKSKIKTPKQIRYPSVVVHIFIFCQEIKKRKSATTTTGSTPPHQNLSFVLLG